MGLLASSLTLLPAAPLLAQGVADTLSATIGSVSKAAPMSVAVPTGPVRVEAVQVELVADKTAVVPGQPLQLGLRIAHDPHWHTYWRNPGDSGLPTQLDLKLPEGLRAGTIAWPAPQRLFIPPLANYGYEGEIVLPVPAQAAAVLAGEEMLISAKAQWLMCREVCIPGEAELALRLPINRDGAAAASAFAPLFERAAARQPAGELAVQAFADGEKLSIALPGPARAAEFFPYEEGLLRYAERQVLYAIDGAAPQRARLELKLSADGAQRAARDADGLRAAAAGIVIVDGKIHELAVTPASAAFAGGAEISRVAGVPAGGAPTGAGAAGAGLASGRDGTPGSAPGAGGLLGSAALAAPGLWLAVLFGVLGGLILNLMPCVFPVIGLKVLGFASHGAAGAEARSASRHGALAFAAGVVVSFWVLAALLLALRAAGEAAGWGFQLQSPPFVAAMALLFVAIALNFSGVYEIGTALTRLGPSPSAAVAPPRHPLAGSFGAGVLAVLVATPCTAPFMGSALGYTLAGSALESLLVFTAVGVGMALPYLLLGLFPAWLRWLPRPGRWMETLKQALAFPMYATAAWLAWVLGQQVGIDAVLALAIGAVLLGLAAWSYGRFVQQGSSAWRGWGALVSVLGVVAALWIAWPTADRGSGGEVAAPEAAGPAASGIAGAPGTAGAAESGWQPWSRERVDQALAEGRPVFVDFTAAWCVSCQVNKRLVLDREAVAGEMARLGVLRLRADWTNRNPAITAELARFNRSGVPLYLLYRPGEPQPRLLPELLTPGIVMQSLAGLPSAPLAMR